MPFETISKPAVNQFDDVLAVEAHAKDKAEARKALAAIHAIRDSVYEVNGMDSSRSYYHALVYEALRVAGRVEVHSRRRWHCLLAAAVFLQRVEQS